MTAVIFQRCYEQLALLLRISVMFIDIDLQLSMSVLYIFEVILNEPTHTLTTDDLSGLINLEDRQSTLNEKGNHL